jgi:hypothetical protein
LQGDRSVDPNATDADAQPRTHMGVVAAALVTMGVALRQTVENAHHPATAPAPDQAAEQGTSASPRFARTVLFHVRVLEQKFLVILVFLPTDVPGMIVAQQDVPLGSGLAQPADLASAPINDPGSLRRPAEGISSSIKRIVQDLHDAVISGRLPDELVDIDIAQDDGHLDGGRAQPQKDLPRAAQFAEPGKDEPDRFGHVLVRSDRDLARLGPAQAWRKHELELATPRFGVAGGDATLAHQAQFIFRHRPLQPKQQTIVDMAGIVGTIRIDDQRSRKRAQVDQMMPVPPVARQS